MRRPGQAGFSLIELMVALTILTIGLMSLIGLVMVGVRASSFSRHNTEASALAQDKMEELFTRNTPASGTDQVTVSSFVFDRSWTVGTGSPMTIAVTVQWQDIAESSPRSLTMVTEKL